MTKKEDFMRELAAENIELKSEVEILKKQLEDAAKGKTIKPSNNKDLLEVFEEKFETIIYSKFPFVSIKFYDNRVMIAGLTIDIRWYYRGKEHAMRNEIDFDLIAAHYDFDDIIRITAESILEKIAKEG